MANKKNKLSKPTKSCSGLHFKVRIKNDEKSGEHFVVTNSRKKIIGGKEFKSHDEALAFAKGLHDKTVNL